MVKSTSDLSAGPLMQILCVKRKNHARDLTATAQEDLHLRRTQRRLACFSAGAVQSGERCAHDFFFREGQGANAFFILEQGRVAVIKDWQGHQFLLSELSEGDCFGEMALIEVHARNASVLALEACRAIRLRFDSVIKLYKRDLQQFTLLQMNMARELSRRLRDANERLFESRVNPEARMQEPGYPEFSPSYH